MTIKIGVVSSPIKFSWKRQYLGGKPFITFRVLQRQ
jgi:hypothetical protein